MRDRMALNSCLKSRRMKAVSCSFLCKILSVDKDWFVLVTKIFRIVRRRKRGLYFIQKHSFLCVAWFWVSMFKYVLVSAGCWDMSVLFLNWIEFVAVPAGVITIVPLGEVSGESVKKNDSTSAGQGRCFPGEIILPCARLGWRPVKTTIGFSSLLWWDLLNHKPLAMAKTQSHVGPAA